MVIFFENEIPEEYDWIIRVGTCYTVISEALQLFKNLSIMRVEEAILKTHNIMN